MAGVAGKSGAKKKPNEQKLLSGSRNANPDAVVFDLVVNIDPPWWMQKEGRELAREMWERLCPHLCSQKILAATDLHNLEIFCSAYQTFRDADDLALKDGIVVTGATGGPIKNPALTAKNEAIRQIDSIGSSLGLSPAARGRLMGSAGGKEKGNEFGDF